MKRWAVLWLLSLAVVAALTSVLTYAQVRQKIEPRVMSGNDVGFRVEGVNFRGEPVGTVVIRVNDEWIAVGSAPTSRPVN